MVVYLSDLYPIARHYYFKGLYAFFPQLKYKKEVKNQTFGAFSYLNFWDNEDLSQFWLARFIEARKLNPQQKKIYFISCFGNPEVVKYANDGVKIFFTAEYLGPERYAEYQDHLLHDVDLALGFSEELTHEKYLRFPLYLFHLLEPEMRFEAIQARIDELSKRDPASKAKFAALIARHDMGGTRTQAYHTLEKIGKVDCPSRLFHNLDIDLPDYEAKRTFLEEYRYTICPENIVKPGYVTEKIADAIRSKCIPVYQGGLTEQDKKIFNPEHILWIDEDLDQKVKELEINAERLQDYPSAFMPNAAGELADWFDRLEKKLKLILDR